MPTNDFLQQFMAGWGMGMDRVQQKRRDEMMARQAEQEQYQRQQDAEERALRMEALKFQKQQADQQIKRQRLEDAFMEHKTRAEALAMQSSLPTPTAAEVGIPEQGPEFGGPMASQIQVPQPTQALPSLMGGPDIQMPIPTGRQQQEMAQAAQQKKMLEALGMLRQQEAVKAEFRQPERPVSVSPGGTLVDPATGKVLFKAPESVSSGQGGMNPKQESNFRSVTTKFQSDPAMKASQDAEAAISLAEQAIANPGSAPNQLMVVYSMIKNLDQGSAVREGETALIQSTLSYLDRYQNAFAKLSRNQLIPPETAKEFAEATKSLARRWVDIGKRKVKQYKAQAKGLGIGEQFDMYLSESGIGGATDTAQPKATHKWTPQGGIIPIGGR